MPVTVEQLQSIRSTINDNIRPLLATAGAAGPYAMAIGFAADLILRAITLGVQIRIVRDKLVAELDLESKKLNIFRRPYIVSIDDFDVTSFFTNKGYLRIQYPQLLEQFDAEIKAVDFVGNTGYDSALRLLKIAHQVILPAYHTGKFINPLWRDMFGNELEKPMPDYYAIVREIDVLGYRDDSEMDNLAAKLPPYWDTKLELARVSLERTYKEQNAKYKDEVISAILEALSGKDGAISALTTFAKEIAKNNVESELAKIDKALSANPDESVKAKLSEQMKELQQRLSAIEGL